MEQNEDQKRILTRIWLDVPNFRKFSDDAIIRYGIGRHGQLGWSVDDIIAGRNAHPRQRRADGAVALG